MRLKLNILLITLLALFSCAKESGERVDYGPETGNLYVRFDVSDMTPTPIVGVKEDNEDEGHVLLEDGVMREGRMWLVDKDDNVVVFRKMEDTFTDEQKQLVHELIVESEVYQAVRKHFNDQIEFDGNFII